MKDIVGYLVSAESNLRHLNIYNQFICVNDYESSKKNKAIKINKAEPVYSKASHDKLVAENTAKDDIIKKAEKYLKKVGEGNWATHDIDYTSYYHCCNTSVPSRNGHKPKCKLIKLLAKIAAMKGEE